MFRYFYLDSFLNTPITESFLDRISNDFDLIRNAGLKCIIRFAYTDQYSKVDGFGSPIPPFMDSPSHELLLQHIEQLSQLTLSNSDIILIIQNGFWGIWSENYYSDVYGCEFFEPVTNEQWLLRKEVTDHVLDMVQEDRMVSLRYPLLKKEFYDLSLPNDSITLNTAHLSDDLARLGGHNDCFSVADNDYTFDDTLTKKPFLGDRK